MTARYGDAAAGWEIYKRLHGEVSLAELNEALQAEGFRPIAPRTYSHYQKLARLNYENYVSINRLDLRHATSSVFDVLDRSRYVDRPFDAPAVVIVPGKTDVDQLGGQVIRVSEGFASFVTGTTPSARRVGRAQKYNRGILIFERVGVERAIEVRESVELKGQTELLLAFRSLLETDLLFPNLVGPTSVERITVPLGDDPSLYSVMTVFHRSFDLYESLREFADLYASAAMPERRPVLATPRVRRLRVESPFELDLVGSPLVWPLVVVTIRIVVPIVMGAVRDLQQVRNQTAEEGRRRERHAREMESRQLENIKKRIEIGQLLEELEPAMREHLGLESLADSREPNAERVEALKDQAVEAAAEIALEGTADIELGAPEDVGDEVLPADSPED